jgi:hypothetical protein
MGHHVLIIAYFSSSVTTCNYSLRRCAVLSSRPQAHYASLSCANKARWDMVMKRLLHAEMTKIEYLRFIELQSVQGNY